MRRFHPLAMLLVPVVAVSAFQVAYVAAGSELSPLADRLSSVALALGFVLWAEADARRRRALPCHDFGFLFAVYFPASLLWYAVWSRGRRGLITLAALLGLMLVPWLAAVVAWLLLHGMA